MKQLLFFPIILKDFIFFRRASRKSAFRFSVRLRDVYPCIFDKTATTGFDRHYIYHTAWAARKVFQINPKFHADLSSSLYFSSIVSAFVPVKFYDYRPADLHLNNMEGGAANLLNLHFESESIKSLSCMHTIEHVGLGRYGDLLDPNGDVKAIAELKRVLAPGGSLLFVVPMGKPRIQFNAHRIYSYDQAVEHFSGFDIREFYFIPDRGDPVTNPDPKIVQEQKYGCGCFWFIKPQDAK